MSDSTVSTDTELAAEIATGLRSLAVLIETNPDLASELRYSLSKLLMAVPMTDEQERLARWARAGKELGAKITKDASDSQFEVAVAFGPVAVRVIAPRESVCERVVVGTEKVTKKVPDPVALAAVPEIEVIEVVEQIRWECKPLLAGEPVTAGSVTA